MPDEIRESEEVGRKQPIDTEKYVALVGRRHMHFLLPFFLGWLVVWSASWILPARYKSSTLILVEEPSMPRDYVQPNISENLQYRLQSITEQILSRTRLTSIIDKLHLYPSGRRHLTADEQVDMMRKDIDVELVRDTHNQQITAFRIYYSAADPRVAQRVTADLTELFIEENLKVRQRESQDTTAFIGSQVDNARATLSEQEERIREFKAKYQGELPSQQASNLQILSGLQAQLQTEQDALNGARQQGVYLQSLVEQYRAMRGGGENQTTSSGLPAIETELASLRSRLANLSAHYTEEYPDIQKLRGEIARTEKLRDDLAAELKAEPPRGERAGLPGANAQAGDSPVLLQLQSQLQANRVEVSNRQQAVTDLKAKINGYQARLNNEPAREQELADLSRGYDQSKANYDDLLKKMNQSTMATSMEQMEQGERFRMIDPPSLPLTPYFPNRLRMCALGIAAGLALGLLVAGGFEALDGRLHREEEVKAHLPTPIICTIPEIQVAEEAGKRRLRLVLGWMTATLVLAIVAAGSAFSYLHE